jgi:hypothetical protein
VRTSNEVALITVSDDDFARDALEETKAYVIKRKNEGDREVIKATNRLRKKAGLPSLKLPPKIKETKKRARQSSSDDTSQLSEGVDVRPITGKRTGRAQMEENIKYEGR